MLLRIKQAFCEHSYRICTENTYMSCGDEYNKISSIKMTLTCMKCGKRIEIFDKHKYYLSQLLQNISK